MKAEIWKPVAGFEKSHEVSNDGRVRTIVREYVGAHGGMRRTRLRVIAQHLEIRGYKMVSLTRNGRSAMRVVHRLVLEAFCGPPPSDRHVANHIDGNKTNNCPENLEWCTQMENVHHAMEIGLMDNSGEANGCAKLTEADVRDIRRLRAGGLKYRELSERFGVSFGPLWKIVNRQAWRHVA